MSSAGMREKIKEAAIKPAVRDIFFNACFSVLNKKIKYIIITTPKIIIALLLRVKSINEIFIKAQNARTGWNLLLTYSLIMMMNGSAGRIYSTAKLRCPNVEPGGIISGKGNGFI
jgi:hypothetical protein